MSLVSSFHFDIIQVILIWPSAIWTSCNIINTILRIVITLKLGTFGKLNRGLLRKLRSNVNGYFWHWLLRYLTLLPFSGAMLILALTTPFLFSCDSASLAGLRLESSRKWLRRETVRQRFVEIPQEHLQKPRSVYPSLLAGPVLTARRGRLGMRWPALFQGLPTHCGPLLHALGIWLCAATSLPRLASFYTHKVSSYRCHLVAMWRKWEDVCSPRD